MSKKARASKCDPHLALLDWRNTPSAELGTSPVQRLLGRRTKTLLPTSSALLKPETPANVNYKLKLQKAKQAKYYNRGTKELDDLLPGDIICILSRVANANHGRRGRWTAKSLAVHTTSKQRMMGSIA